MSAPDFYHLVAKMIDVLFDGIGWAAIAMILSRVAAGVFFEKVRRDRRLGLRSI
ncbi:MAG: hypothetical protein ACLPX9_02990 [Rhodomicrobium sp.]